MANQIQGTYLAAAPITAATAPSVCYANRYNASSGALAITLPALSTLGDGVNFTVEKDTLDGTLNTVTFNANGADTFDDGSTSLLLRRPGEKRVLQVVTIPTTTGTKYWKVLYGLNPATGLTATTSQVALTNSTTATTLVTATLAPAVLYAGATFLLTINGTIQVTSTSGALTFTPFIQGTALAQTAVMTTQTSAAGPVPFQLEYWITVRATGTTGTAIAKPWGQINFTAPAYLASTSAATTTINTTSAASSTALYLQAQWATANAANSLLVDTAAIERVV